MIYHLSYGVSIIILLMFRTFLLTFSPYLLKLLLTLPSTSLDHLALRVFDELLALNLIPPTTNILHSQVHPLPNHYRSYILEHQYSLHESIVNHQSSLLQFYNLGPLPSFPNNQSSIIQRSYEFAKNFRLP